MKFLILLTGGRSGSDLLQSLLDSHPQILQFPGFFRFDKPFINILNEKYPQKIPALARGITQTELCSSYNGATGENF